MNGKNKIVAVDDNLTSLNALTKILNPYYEVFPVSSAARMFDLLGHVSADMILLDVAMPEISGYDTIKLLKHNHEYSDIPVVFITALNNQQNELEGFELGAVDYIYKPYIAPLLLHRISTHLTLLEQKKELQNLNETIQKMLVVKIGEVFDLQNAILNIVSGMVESRDDTTGGHIHRIQKYLNSLIDGLAKTNLYCDELNSWDMSFLLPSSQLHDLGKIAISDSILNKPGKLTPDEFEIMKTHAQIGVDAICRMEKTTRDSGFLKYAKTFAGTHHERWDGTGYPNGMKGAEIPLEGRIMAIADVYDALASARPYKEPFSHERASAIIKEGCGTQFDPSLIDAFDSIADDFKRIAAIPQERVKNPVVPFPRAS